MKAALARPAIGPHSRQSGFFLAYFTAAKKIRPK
jgi:hypothetical protein